MEDNGNPGGNNPNINLETVLHSNNGGNIPNPNDGQNQNKEDGDKKDNNKQKQQGQQKQQPNPFDVIDNQQTEYEKTLSFLTGEDSNLSEEDLNTKKEVLSVFKGEGIDQQGNILNKEGSVVFTSEQLKNYIEKGELPTDDKGNQINNLGEIIKSAEDIAKEESVVLNTRDSIQEELGIKLLDEEGNPLEYEDTTEGIISLVKDAIQTRNVDAVQSFLESNPVLNDVFKHLALGGDLSNYNNDSIDYKSIDLNSLDKTAKIQLIKDSYKKQGLKNPEKFISLIEKAGDERIEQEAAEAALTLDSLQKEARTERDKQFKQQQQRQQEETRQYWNNVKEIVDKGQLGDINIPKSEREEFFNYMARPADKQGRSRDQIAEDNEKEDFKLMVSYLRYKNYDLSKLASLMAKENKVTSLRERLKKADGKVISEKTRNAGSVTKGAQPIPSLDKLLGIKK